LTWIVALGRRRARGESSTSSFDSAEDRYVDRLDDELAVFDD
jgi:hypothetical protein